MMATVVAIDSVITFIMFYKYSKKEHLTFK